MRSSVAGPSAEVASSSTSSPGWSSKARARARRWRCPPESATPPSPTWVSSPWGRFATNPVASACLSAHQTSSAVASGLPKRTLSATVPVSSTVSSKTMPTERRSATRGTSRTSIPPITTATASGSSNLGRSAHRVDFPEPASPSRATTSPWCRLRLTPAVPRDPRHAGRARPPGVHVQSPGGGYAGAPARRWLARWTAAGRSGRSPRAPAGPRPGSRRTYGRRSQLGEIARKGHEGTDRHLPVQRKPSTEPQNPGLHQQRNGLKLRGYGGSKPDVAHARPVKGACSSFKACNLVVLLREGPHHLCADHRVRNHSGELALTLLGIPARRVHGRAETPRRNEARRRDHEWETHEPRIEHRHHRDGEQRLDHAREHHRSPGEHLLEEAEVTRRPGDELASPKAFVRGEIQGDEVRVERVAHVELDFEGHPPPTKRRTSLLANLTSPTPARPSSSPSRSRWRPAASSMASRWKRGMTASEPIDTTAAPSVTMTSPRCGRSRGHTCGQNPRASVLKECAPGPARPASPTQRLSSHRRPTGTGHGTPVRP